jgi:hypothetical protein
VIARVKDSEDALDDRLPGGRDHPAPTSADPLTFPPASPGLLQVLGSLGRDCARFVFFFLLSRCAIEEDTVWRSYVSQIGGVEVVVANM